MIIKDLFKKPIDKSKFFPDIAPTMTLLTYSGKISFIRLITVSMEMEKESAIITMIVNIGILAKTKL